MADLAEWLKFWTGRRIRVDLSASSGQVGLQMLAGEVSEVDGDGFLLDNVGSKADVAYAQGATPPEVH